MSKRIKYTEEDERKLKQFRFNVMNELERLESDPVYFYEHYCDKNHQKDPHGGLEFFRKIRVLLTKFSKGHFTITK